MQNTAGFITTPQFNRLTKTNFDARMKGATKSLVTKTQADTALEMADKNKEKKTFFKRLI